jgi:hypothetical protein
LSRSTQDIDIVDEVPAEVREQHQLLSRLAKRYGPQLTHFQSHFLPAGWEARLHSLGSFGAMQAFGVDVHDVFLSKLFSSREKDLDDLRLLLPQLEREVVARRPGETCGRLVAAAALRANADRNWYVLTGKALPV